MCNERLGVKVRVCKALSFFHFFFPSLFFSFSLSLLSVSPSRFLYFSSSVSFSLSFILFFFFFLLLLLLLLLFHAKNVRPTTSEKKVCLAIFFASEEKTLVFTMFLQRQGRKSSKKGEFTLFFSECVENTVFCDVFSTRGFKCPRKYHGFLHFLFPVL